MLRFACWPNSYRMETAWAAAERHMGYQMEELLPVVGKLVEKYTAWESTSVSYEKAEQLMGAVLYCIRAVEEEGRNQVMALNEIQAQKAYEMGRDCVEKKVKAALSLYHDILAEFDSYGNRCLEDTFIHGMPEFFKWYDVKYAPQDTILTLDYPVLRDLTGYTGIYRIYGYIDCIRLEQKFLGAFPREYVMEKLREYESACADMIDNLCEVMLSAVVWQMYGEQSASGGIFEPQENEQIRQKFASMEVTEISGQIGRMAAAFVKEYCGDDEELSAYLSLCVQNIAVRIKAA